MRELAERLGPLPDTILPAGLIAFASLRGDVFTAAEAAEHGFGRERLRAAVAAGEVVRIIRGVYADRSTYERAAETALTTYDMRAAAAVARMRRSCLVSHESAATVWRMALLKSPPPEIRVTRPALSRTGTQWQGGVRITHASLRPAHRRMTRGVLITSPARTVVDLARSLPMREAVVVADAAMRRGLVSRGGLVLAARDCSTWPRALEAQRVARFADRRAESALESVSRVVFHEYNLPAPELQIHIGREPLLHRVDFLWREQRTIGEADGRSKYTSLDVVYSEKRRQDDLHRLGYELVRWGWEIDTDPAGVIRRVLDTFDLASRRFNL